MPAAIGQLNPQQQAAVTASTRHTLVIAGAGSGKTRVLVQRCIWLMQNQHLAPHQILAVTFTNKAAKEMRQRIENEVDLPLPGLWCGTFHSLCHRLLRQHHDLAGLPETFQILDQDDQQRCIKKIQKEMGLDEAQWPAKKTQAMINKFKEQGIRAAHAFQDNTHYAKTMGAVYQHYESHCQTSAWVDFAELLLKTVECFEHNQTLRTQYHERFQHLLIDEFQDTNILQYRWIQNLCGPQTRITAVGDDDQSIYSWRGAKMDHLLKFKDDFKDVEVIRLEQNYRSTATILKAANHLIACNVQRMGKTLWTEGSSGDNIARYNAYNEFDEAQYLCHQIQAAQQDGSDLSDIAILYRSNAQSRIIEEHLTRAGLPYRVYGGLRFFERAEIKDALGYLRLIARRSDDGAFERIVNTPTRGIGHATLTQLRNTARAQNSSLWDAAAHCVNTQQLSTRSLHALTRFMQLIEALDHDTQHQTLSDICTHVTEHSGLIAAMQQDRSHRGESKVENLYELAHATRGYTAQTPELTPLIDFLSHISLDQGDLHATQPAASVQLMTLHAAKGLEFSTVFLVGLEEGLFPHQMCLQDPKQLEEERRLCYVGMTRAMKTLHLTHAECRRIHGQESFQRPSRFITEIPEEFIDSVRIKHTSPLPQQPAPHTRNSQTHTASTEPSCTLGQHVHHEYFGEGTVLNCEGQDPHTRIQVVFEKHGVKWLMLSQAPLTFK